MASRIAEAGNRAGVAPLAQMTMLCETMGWRDPTTAMRYLHSDETQKRAVLMWAADRTMKGRESG
jgi:hypothetical protein